jgi:hypothetical protein
LTLPASTKGQESPEENEMLKFSQKRIKDAKRRMTFQGIINDIILGRRLSGRRKLMAYFGDGSEAMLQLEAMVDKAGLRNVLWALAHISRAKAHHIEGNWQDKDTAKTWMRDALKISRCAQRLGENHKKPDQRRKRKGAS